MIQKNLSKSSMHISKDKYIDAYNQSYIHRYKWLLQYYCTISVFDVSDSVVSGAASSGSGNFTPIPFKYSTIP